MTVQHLVSDEISDIREDNATLQCTFLFHTRK